MVVSYKRLLHLLIEREMTTIQLQQQAGFASNRTTRIKRNGYLSLNTIKSICHIIKCGVNDILKFMLDTSEDGGNNNGE